MNPKCEGDHTSLKIHKRPWKGKTDFVRKMMILSDVAHVVRMRSFDFSQIDGEQFPRRVYRLQGHCWSDKFIHNYVALHNVKPSKDFLDWVDSISLKTLEYDKKYWNAYFKRHTGKQVIDALKNRSVSLHNKPRVG